MEEKNILYIGYYYKSDVLKQRNSPYISQAGMNKMNFLRSVFQEAGYHTYIFSNAWTSSRSFRKYPAFWSTEDSDVYYSGIFGAPVLNSLSCIRSGKRFIREFMKEHPLSCVVFYNMRWETSALTLYIRKKYHVPIILEYEDGLSIDLNNSKARRRFYAHIEKRVLPKLDGAILVNSILKDRIHCPYMISRGGTTAVEGSLPHPGKDEDKTFLFASTLDDQRGLPVLLEAMRYLKEDCRLYITGQGELEDTLKELQDNRIQYLGYLSYEEYREILKKSHVCICAQKSKASFGQVSFPSKIFEYLSAHKLVITSDVADAAEYLKDAALVYTDDDPKQLADCMREALAIYDNEEKRSYYAAQIENCVRENSVGATAGKFREFIAEIRRNEM
jgi:glycosyltransferase involved in cell wall biosynthesis